MDLVKFILPTKLDNTDENQASGNKRFQTEDLIYLDSYDEVKDISDDERITYPTDYAIMNYALMSHCNQGPKDRKSCCAWLRSAYTSDTIYGIMTNGKLNFDQVDCVNLGLCPALHLNLSSVISARSASRDFFRISEINTKDSGKYHTIEFGEYPKTYVGDRKNKELEKLDSSKRLHATGKTYTGMIDNDGVLTLHFEFEYKGQKYVRVFTQKYDGDSEYSDGTMAPDDGTYMWVKVEPIVWKIRNWDELPKEINPTGSGKAKFIDIKTDEAIISGIPFYPDSDDENCSMWQNSTIRGYLNGINVNNIKTNGNTKFTAPNGGDFREHSFLTEALPSELSLTSSKSAEEDIKQFVKKKQRKGYGIKVLEKPMTVNEQIKFYIETGKSFMLHGPSGVGKTRRIEDADPDFVSIVLRNGILPEEVIGKTIYPNNDKTKAGTWVPPAWYVDLCEKCQKEPDKQHVLFIDEITNVKPSEQSLVFYLVLNNSIGPNIGKLPQNVVVVAAGNSKEESESAYNMPEPLFRRFDGHIELKPDIHQWLEWGSEQSDKGEDRLKIHPLVANFVGAYGSQVFYSPYDSENPPKYAIDPRGWEQVSDIIYDNKGQIARELIENKVGKEIATTFVAFAQTPPLMVEDVINKNYDHDDIPTQFDAKYALALSLRSASIEEIQQVREFINDELGAEILAMFDLVWVGEDNEKAIYLAGLPKLKETEQKEHDTCSSYSQNDERKLPFSKNDDRELPF